MATVLAIPDLHEPWAHPRALGFCQRLARRHRPDLVAEEDDAVDLAALSRFPKDPDLPSAGDELDRAVDALRPWYRSFPRAMVCESNHTWRVFRRAFEGGLPSRAMQPIRTLLSAPRGWRWRRSWVVDGVEYRHGDGLSGRNCARLASERFRRPVVFGHVHSVAQLHRDSHGWALAAGCLIDEAQAAFAYASHSAFRPVLGAAVVTDGVPQWFPLD